MKTIEQIPSNRVGSLKRKMLFPSEYLSVFKTIWRIDAGDGAFQLIPCEIESFDDSVIKHMSPFMSGIKDRKKN